MAGERRRKEKGKPLAAGERRRLRQLIACVLLFGLVVLGRGAGWEPLAQAAEAVTALVRQDTDVQAVFARLGEDLAQGEAVETFQGMWNAVFARGDSP